MRYLKVPFVSGILLCLSFVCSCSGGHTVSVTLSPTSQTLNPNQSVTVTATVTNDTNHEGVNWSLSAGSGSLSDSTTTSVVYTAPSVVSVNTSATLTATSIANSSATATFTATVNAVLAISTTSLPAATQNSPYNAFINATGATTPFTWQITSGSLPPGLNLLASTTSSVVISGTPTTTGKTKFTIQVTDSAGTSVSQALSITVNPPPPVSVQTRSLPPGTVNIPYNASLTASGGSGSYSWALTGGTQLPVGLNLSSGGTISGTPVASGTTDFSVQVTDTSSPPETADANLSITINPAVSNNGKLKGNYAFLVSGFNGTGPPPLPFATAGSFTADGNGNITGGILDTNDSSGPQADVPFTGTYSIGSNNIGTLCFNISSACSRTLALSMSANGNGRIIEFDGTGAWGSGVLLIQDTSAFSSGIAAGDYAFGFLGEDVNRGRFAMAGEFAADGNGNINPGLLDEDDATSGPNPNVAFTGTYTVPASSTNGRGTATLTIGGQTTNYSYYVVSGTQFLTMEVDASGNPLVSGSILQQTGNGSFQNGSLSATDVFETTATCSAASPTQTEAGLFMASSGMFTITADQNCGGTLTSPSIPGTYTVATNGRTTASNGWTMYLVQANEAFIVGTDTAVTFGFLQAQQPPQSGFTNASISGTYAGGSLAPVNPSVNNEVGIGTVGGGVLTFTLDISNSGGQTQNQMSNVEYAVASDGRVVLTLNSATIGILYLIDTSQYVGITAPGDGNGTNPNVVAFRQ